MKIKVMCIGKTGKKFLEEGEKEYLSRLQHYVSIEKIEFPDIKNQKKLTEAQIKIEEGKLFLKKIEPNSIVLLLDERGNAYSSIKFADRLQQLFHTGEKNIYFIIGGAYGFSDEIYSLSHEKISFSKLTFSHQMIRMILFEQLYRAMTILKGEPYHHE